jgi:DNA-binding NarL/FixJ family response regulator
VAGIRTVMVTPPTLLRDLIERLAVGRIELDVVAQLSGRRALARRLQRLRPHLIIVGLREGETDQLIRTLLLQLPAAKFIALSHDGRGIVGYELCVNRMTLSTLSPEALINFAATALADVVTEPTSTPSHRKM